MRPRATILAALVAFALAATPAYAQDPPPDCKDFSTQAEAQDYLDADKSDPGGIDGDVGPATATSDVPDQRPHPGDGIACEGHDYGSSNDADPSPTPEEAGALPFTGPGGATLPVGLVLVVSGAIILAGSRYRARHASR